MCCALLCAFSLPSMDHSLYFHRKTLTLPIECKAPEQLQSKENYSEESSRLNQTRSSYHTNQQPEVDRNDASQSVRNILPDYNTCLQLNNADLSTVSAPKSKWNQAIQLLWMDFKDAYTNPYVFKMCVFISLTTCGYNQVQCQR
uniref:Uncharacterized protein n=1 Tax=Graphocephala atropunctata TaxID=36148 RepID=A0A1B6KDP0_9HEMI